ncbi:hypothetical protein KC887_09735 [Candidatus Kaiserbacteria bacterium]|nr:hypothetical protein [Candidatus Kaiserbacteria bacterium]
MMIIIDILGIVGLVGGVLILLFIWNSEGARADAANHRMQNPDWDETEYFIKTGHQAGGQFLDIDCKGGE